MAFCAGTGVLAFLDLVSALSKGKFKEIQFELHFAFQSSADIVGMDLITECRSRCP